MFMLIVACVTVPVIPLTKMFDGYGAPVVFVAKLTPPGLQKLVKFPLVVTVVWAFTVCVVIPLLPLKLAVAPKVALMACMPSVEKLVEHVACPLVTGCAVHPAIEFPLSVNATVPSLTVVAPLLESLTAAVRVVVLLGAVVNEGLTLELTVVVVLSCAGVVTFKHQLPMVAVPLEPPRSTAYRYQLPFGLEPKNWVASVDEPLLCAEEKLSGGALETSVPLHKLFTTEVGVVQ